MSKMKPKPKPSGPKKPKGGGYRALALSVLLLAAPACGDDGAAEDVATCTVLGGLIAEHLLVNLDCDPELEPLVEFVTACASQQPDERQALVCLDAVYTLEECPSGLPGECLLFGQEALAVDPGCVSPSKCDTPPDPN